MIDILRDRTRDTTCEILQSWSVDAQMAERGRPEEKIGLRPYRKSLGIIDIAEGPIRWINVIRNELRRLYVHILEYEVPDPRLDSSSPNVKITSEPKHKFLLWGKVVDLKWEGEDARLGVVNRLNSDNLLKETIIKSRVNVAINCHGNHGLWVISSDYDQFLSPPTNIPLDDEWRGFLAIASHLLTDWSQDNKSH